MDILEAFDLTGSLRDAAELAGCLASHGGRLCRGPGRRRRCRDRPAARPQLIDEFLPKVEEWMEHSKGKIRADVAHEKLLAMGFTGFGADDPAGGRRRSRRHYQAGRVRVHRPWVTEPGMWLQYDFGDGPIIDGVKTVLFCAWLAWSRFRVVIALRDKTTPSVFAALDVTLRRLGGAPTYLLTDNEKTVTVEHVAGIAVRNPQVVAFARHYGVTVHTCEPADPASQGRVGVDGEAGQGRPGAHRHQPAASQYDSFAELEAACEAFWTKVNARVHRVTRRAPADMLAEERARLHPVPARAAHGRVRGDPHGARSTPRWCPSRAASTRCRTRCSGRRCGCGCTASAATSRS